MAEESPFEDLLERLKNGEQDAARQIFEQYARHLVRLARDHLDRSVRRKLDPEDVVQSAFKSFFARMRDAPFGLENPHSLWSLLVCITLRKCRHKVRDFHSQRHDVRREDDSAASWQALARGPTPSEAAILAETLEQLFGRLKERECQIVQMYLQGDQIEEIQAQVERSEFTVRQVLKRARKCLESQLDEP
jgi:RNA polymerase sigma-70 factor, ECF subfamily